jgi:hypothetical protein
MLQKRLEERWRGLDPSPRNGKVLVDVEQRPDNDGRHTNRGRSTTSLYQQHNTAPRVDEDEEETQGELKLMTVKE